MNCSRCQSPFQLDRSDHAFYEKLGVNKPTWCPACRVQRRMTWRNDRHFYLRKCDLSGKQMVAIYPAEAPFPVYHPDDWYGDGWDPMKFGQDFDFSRPFFEQWEELFLKVPRLGIDIVNCENSYYCNYCGDNKNCYLDIAGEDNEDCYYNLFVKHSKDCVDCTFVYQSELCYESLNSYKCYRVLFSMHLENSSDCAFCFDLKGCRDCLFSSNLRQKQYYIFNEPHTKEEYEAKLKALRLDTHDGLKKARKTWRKIMGTAIHRDMVISNSEACVGNNIKDSKNCENVYNASACEDSKHLYDVLDAKSCRDLNYSLYHPEMSTELMSTLAMKFSAFSMASHYCHNAFYCDLSNHSSNLFGCIGLKRKQYCILNKQYSQEDYEALVPRIIEHMRKTGEWGQFFPTRLAPFGYNETVAQEYYPLDKKPALEQGFSWKEADNDNAYEGPAIELPESIDAAGIDLTKSILRCEQSGELYKIIPQELAFYKKLQLAPPHRSPSQRHRDRMALRPPRHLWDRECSQCGSEIHSVYHPQRSEKVFCEECYLKTIY